MLSATLSPRAGLSTCGLPRTGRLLINTGLDLYAEKGVNSLIGHGRAIEQILVVLEKDPSFAKLNEDEVETFKRVFKERCDAAYANSPRKRGRRS